MRKLSLLLAVILAMTALGACAKAGSSQEVPVDDTQTAAEIQPAVEIKSDETKPAGTEPSQTESAKTETAAEPVTAEETTLPKSVGADWIEISDNKEVLTVRLDSNPTTGYMWEYKISDDKVLELLTDEFIAPEQNGMAGAGGQWAASFKPTGSKDGDVKLTLMYQRPWEKQPIRSIELRIIVQGTQLSVIDISEATRTMDVLEDGTWKVSVDSEQLNHDGESVTGYVQIMKPVVLADEDVQNLKAGDSIALERYGLGDFYVEEYTKKDDNTIDAGIVTFEKKDDLGGWIIVGMDDDITSYVDKDAYVNIPDGVELDDQMGQIVFSGEQKFSSFWDAAQEYHFFDAEFTVKDGITEKVVIFYHP